MTTTETAGHTQPSSDVATDTRDSDTTEAPGTTEASDATEGDDATTDTDAKEAQKYRRRAQAAEAERDQLRTQLDALQQEVIDDMCRRANLDRRLLTTAGHDTSTMLDDAGNLDRQKITEAITATQQEFPGRRPPAANPQQGSGVGTATHRTVGDTINKALGR